MRTFDDLRREVVHAERKNLRSLLVFAVPAFTPEQRLKLDEMDPPYLAALEHCRFQEIPLTYDGAVRLLDILIPPPERRTPTAMEERVAGALFAARHSATNIGRTLKDVVFGDPTITWDDVLAGVASGRFVPLAVEGYFDEARAVIRAMREPTSEMRAAAEQAMKGVLVSKANVAEVYWPAAIDAASPEVRT